MFKSPRDSIILQSDLDHLAEWEQKWKMEFHPDKCEVIHISHKRNTIKHEYNLHGHIIKAVTAAKYLGVTITSDLKWNRHIGSAATKANRVLGFLRRNLKVKSSSLKEKAYKTLVRPSMEYAASVWDPYTDNNINRLEMVQRRAARYTLNQWERCASVTAMLSTLAWRPLWVRRRDMRLVMLYKIAGWSRYLRMAISYRLPEHLGIAMNWDSKYHTQQRNSTSSPSTQEQSVNGMPYQLKYLSQVLLNHSRAT